ncbi:MAG TPA: N-6 DNA methylase, partial [Pyrinomonadaceae bacterium]|nr:N-6 DNA methylase [Pyrinomonadaceae bacterium]
KFDFAVANPPFSTKSWSNGLTPYQDPLGRFADGVPPDKNGDYAFFQHLLRSLNRNGKGAIILPHGVLFRGNAEAEIRKNIIRKGYIKGIIGLPANLFYGTGIPACIIVVDKENAEARRGIFMIDASKGFVKDGNKNRLRHQDIHKIVDVFNKRIELEKYSRMVSFAEIEKNEYNLNIPRYIDSQEAEDIQDISAHLFGGIPNRDIDALENYWRVFPTLKSSLFSDGNREGYSQLNIPHTEIKSAIYDFPEFQTFRIEVNGVIVSWRERFTPILKGLNLSDSPKALIENISEAILQDFEKVNLIDNYDIYQHLMTFWTETMQDDVYLIISDGWKATEDLIPPDLIVKRYFSAEQANIENLEAEKENITREREEFEEEFGGEGEKAFLEDCRNEKGKITKVEVGKRSKDLQKEKLLNNADLAEELKVLDNYLRLVNREAVANKRVKDAKAELDRKVSAKYKVLSEDEIKVLVVDDKWMQTIENAVTGELER